MPVTGLQDEVREKDKVGYTVERGKKGLNAVDVKLV
jgi:CspA family cold shock protein